MMKKKKLLKHLLPLLVALKVKLSAFAVIAYIVIALIAKKALLASVISLIVSGFIFVKKLLSQHHHTPHHEVVSIIFIFKLPLRSNFNISLLKLIKY